MNIKVIQGIMNRYDCVFSGFCADDDPGCGAWMKNSDPDKAFRMLKIQRKNHERTVRYSILYDSRS